MEQYNSVTKNSDSNHSKGIAVSYVLKEIIYYFLKSRDKKTKMCVAENLMSDSANCLM